MSRTCRLIDTRYPSHAPPIRLAVGDNCAYIAERSRQQSTSFTCGSIFRSASLDHRNRDTPAIFRSLSTLARLHAIPHHITARIATLLRPTASRNQRNCSCSCSAPPSSSNAAAGFLSRIRANNQTTTQHAHQAKPPPAAQNVRSRPRIGPHLRRPALPAPHQTPRPNPLLSASRLPNPPLLPPHHRSPHRPPRTPPGPPPARHRDQRPGVQRGRGERRVPRLQGGEEEGEGEAEGYG